MRAWVLCIVVLGCGTPAKPIAPVSPPPIAAAKPPSKMDTFTINGYLLAGAEYWPYAGTAELDYPKEVLWGFYPEKGVTAVGETDPNIDNARPEAIACAEQAYAALHAFVTSDPKLLRLIVELGEHHGYVPRFFLWTNDYTRAATPYPPGVREARLWYWKRPRGAKEKTPDPVRPPGYWKWESTLTQAGECQLPKLDQIEHYLTETFVSLLPGQ